jgi:hypothetical protein
MIFFSSPRLTQSPSLVGFVEFAPANQENAGTVSGDDQE